MILLSGGTGNLGPVLAKLLASRGIPLRILTRDTSRARARLAGNLELVTGDVRVASSLGPALVGVDTVISAVTGFGPGGDGPREVDFEGNQNLIAAAVSAGAKHFILVSIHGARADHPMNLYRAKFMAEERLQASVLDWTIVRPTAFMELWAGIVGDSLVKGGSATVFGRGQNPINLVSVEDVARFLELAVVDPTLRRTILDIGGPENLTLNDVVAIIATTNGLQPKARHIPVTALRAGALLVRPFRADLAGLIQASLLMDTADMSFDPAALEANYPQIRLTQLADIALARRATAVTA